MAAKQAEKEAAAKLVKPEAPKEQVWDPNADLSKMTMGEQLKWNMMKMKMNQEAKNKKAAEDKA